MEIGEGEREREKRERYPVLECFCGGSLYDLPTVFKNVIDSNLNGYGYQICFKLLTFSPWGVGNNGQRRDAKQYQTYPVDNPPGTIGEEFCIAKRTWRPARGDRKPFLYIVSTRNMCAGEQSTLKFVAAAGFFERLSGVYKISCQRNFKFRRQGHCLPRQSLCTVTRASKSPKVQLSRFDPLDMMGGSAKSSPVARPDSTIVVYHRHKFNFINVFHIARASLQGRNSLMANVVLSRKPKQLIRMACQTERRSGSCHASAWPAWRKIFARNTLS